MGLLDEAGLERLVAAGCTQCGSHKLGFRTFVDGVLPLLGGEPVGRMTWAYDGEKFIDGVYRIRCLACSDDAFASPDCPRCHRPGGLADALASSARLAVPKRCPSCKGTELTVLAFVPARVRTGEGRPGAPTLIAQYGEPGFHIAGLMCDGCDWVAAPEGCPLCGGPGPLRGRP